MEVPCGWWFMSDREMSDFKRQINYVLWLMPLVVALFSAGGAWAVTSFQLNALNQAQAKDIKDTEDRIRAWSEWRTQTDKNVTELQTVIRLMAEDVREIKQTVRVLK